MIITVTLNPALDKTIYIHGFRQGELNRVEDTIVTPGGKGINVSLVLKQLGEPNIAVGLFGGGTGISIVGKLNLKGIRTEQVLVQGETRTNLKIISGSELTEINESGPEVTEENLSKLGDVIKKYATEGNIFIFSGSVPKSVDSRIYYRLIEMVRSQGAIAILDADGEVFKEGVEAVPYAIKPNLHELFAYRDEVFGGMVPEDYKDYVIEYAGDFIKKGVKFVCVSLGADGAYFTDGVNNMFLPSLVKNDEIRSAVGAGDSMVAAIAYGIGHGLDFEGISNLAMRAASVACGAVEL